MFGIHLKRKKTQNWIKAGQPSVSLVSSSTVQHNSELFSFACCVWDDLEWVIWLLCLHINCLYYSCRRGPPHLFKPYR